LLCGECEEPFGEGGVRVRSGRNHSEVVRVSERVVHSEAHQADEKALPLYDQRHRRQYGIRAVAAHDKIDAVFIHQPFVDAGNL
jgi:hypothetical protein